jgi:hypothetical protein
MVKKALTCTSQQKPRRPSGAKKGGGCLRFPQHAIYPIRWASVLGKSVFAVIGDNFLSSNSKSLQVDYCMGTHLDQ